MSTTPPNVLQLARQGDPDAIAALMNRHLETQGITAHVVQQESTLQVDLEGAQIPSQVDLVAFVKKGITGLELATIQRLTVSGKQAGATDHAWSEELVLQTATSDFELDFDAAPEAAIAADDLTSDDLDLAFDLNDPALDSADFGDLDAALGNDISGADLDLDLGLADSDLDSALGSDLDLGAPADLDFTDNDFGLDLSDAGTGPETTDSFDLDLSDAGMGPEAAADLDLDLSDDLAADLSADSGFDLDLGMAEETPADPNGFDLDFGMADTTPAEPLDFDLGLSEADAEPPSDSADLDFDLGLPDAPAANDLPADLDFDLASADEPAEAASASDLDFDLDLGDSTTDTSADLDLGWVDESATDSSAEPFDLDFDPTAEAAGDRSTEELDFDLGLTETPAAEDTTDDLALDTADFDLGFDSEAADSEASLGASNDLDLDFDTEFTPAGDRDLTDAEAGFDLNAPAPTLENPAIEADLDDLWGDGDSDAIAPGPAAADLSAMDDLAAFDTDLTTDEESAEASLDDWSDLGAISEDLELEAIETDAAEADAIAFADLGPEAEALSFETSDSPDVFSSDLPTTDQSTFEDLGAADDLDRAANLELTDDWATAQPEFSLSEADTHLNDAADLDFNAAALAEDSTAALDTPFSSDYGDFESVAEPDLPSDMLSEDTLTTDWDAAAPDLSADLGTDFDTDLGTDFNADWAEPTPAPEVSSSPPPWEEPTGDFDPGLILDTSGGADDLGNEFDPNLVFDPSDDAVDATPNPFAVEALADDPYAFAAPDFEAEAGGLEDIAPDFTPGFEPEFAPEADADLPFSTMELDQTAAGNVVPNLTSDDGPGEPDAYDAAFFAAQPEAYATEPTSVPMEFGDDADADLAFESVEYDGDDLGGSGVETPGFSVGGFTDEPDFATSAFEQDEFSRETGFGNENFEGEGFGDEDFGNEGFSDEGLGADRFSDSHEDNNGLIQDRNGAMLIDDEPDAADDFIQEFGSDPSTHVALTPDQFNDDGSVRRSGSSGLPLRLIVGLGLGALVLALAGLLLNGLLGRLRSPEGDPAVTQPVPNPDSLPTDPTAVAEDDLFRQAVNAAQTAANQAQTASTSAQWQEVADTWALAIALMQRVPASDPNYATAQQKAIDYQPNLNYAQQNADQLQ